MPTQATKRNRHQTRKARRMLGAPSSVRRWSTTKHGDPLTTGRQETASQRKHRKRAERRNRVKPPIDPMEALAKAGAFDRTSELVKGAGEAFRNLGEVANEATMTVEAARASLDLEEVTHTLRYEGAPHDEYGLRIGTGQGGVGRARCACGELSPELTSRSQRRAWYREHREARA